MLVIAAVEARTIKLNDAALEKAYGQLVSLQTKAENEQSFLKRAHSNGRDTTPGFKQLRKAEEDFRAVEVGLPALQQRSSSWVPIPHSLLPPTPRETQEDIAFSFPYPPPVLEQQPISRPMDLPTPFHEQQSLMYSRQVQFGEMSTVCSFIFQQ